MSDTRSRRRLPHPVMQGAALLLVLLLACRADAQSPLNLDFELGGVGEPQRPWGWTWGWSVFTSGPMAVCSSDSLVFMQGRRSLALEIPPEHAPAPLQALMLQVPARFALGHTLQLDLHLRVTNPAARAVVSLEAWGDRVVAAADSVSLRGSEAGDAAWQVRHLTLAVPRDSTVHSVVIQVGLEGSGKAWFDGGQLHLDGHAITTLPAVSDPPTPAERAALAHHGQVLERVDEDPATGDGDLSLFLEAVQGARVVGLGESTHGTGEFFRLKHRLVEGLVRREGFRVFALEANVLTAARLDAWVQGGPGTVEQAMAGLFTVWHVEEVRELLTGLRDYNRAHPGDPVTVVGFDMQDHRTPVDTLRAVIARLEPGLGGTIDELLGEYTSQPSFATWSEEDSIRTRWADQAATLWHILAARRPAWLAAARSARDSIDAEWALHCASLVSQAAELNRTLYSPDRDSLMAANLVWALDTRLPGRRAVLWAHDMHVSRSGDPLTGFNGGKQMGAFLHRLYGSGYRCYSLLTHAGRYQATRSFTDHTPLQAALWPAPEGSLEMALQGLPRPEGSLGWFLDLHRAAAAPEGGWLGQPRPVRSIGFAAVDYGFEMHAVMPREFDGVFFVENTGASHPLP
jgi:erythromycin esterase